MAREFSQSGSTVVITSRKKRLAQRTCMLLSDKCQGLELDITDRSSVSKFLKSIRKTYGRVDVLINNAGFPFRRKIWFKKLHEVSDKELIDIIQVDLVGSFRLSKEIIPLMLRHRSGGVIINIVFYPFSLRSHLRISVLFGKGWRCLFDKAYCIRVCFTKN